MTSPPRASILIVDDSRETRDIYADYLSYFGYCVAGAGSASEALEMIRSLQPDVIVIDLTLPGMDGYEATRRLPCLPEELLSAIETVLRRPNAGADATSA
ncbi:MAG: response regulator [Candidatus Rokuibacteriota bacterium]|nr:MAG: response regulator [Candidatus Rokubacteria bacterium]